VILIIGDIVKKAYRLAALFVAVLIIGCASSGVVPEEATEIVNIVQTGKPADDAFDLSMKWVCENYISENNGVMKYSDKNKEMIAMEARMPGGGLTDIEYRMSIEIKDSRARLTYKLLDAHIGLVDDAGNVKIIKMAITQKTVDQVKDKADKITADYTQYITTHSSDF
jgi:hypothetical protein